MIRTTSPRRRTLGGLAALVVVPVLMIGLSACSPANGGDATNQPNTDTRSTGGQSATLAEWQLSLAECLRGEGIDAPDPTGDGGMVAMGAPSQAEMAALEAASEKCRAELGDPPAMSAEDVAAANEEFLEWLRPIVACYRENGVDMPDPKAGESPQWPADLPESVKEKCGGGAGSTTTRTQ